MLLNYENTFKGINHPIMQINSVDGETFTITAKITSGCGQPIDLGEYELSALYQPSSEVCKTDNFRSLEVSEKMAWQS